MSTPSGIKVPSSVSDSFADAIKNAQSTRAVVFVIEGESFKTLTTIAPSQSFKEDIALLLPTLPNAKTCASFAYRTDQRSGGGWEWLLITYVPDDAGVRQKMLQASSKAGLLKALGEGRFKSSMFFTSPSDLTPSSFSDHLSHLEAPPPLTASEAMLAQIKLDEEAEAKRSSSGFGGRGGGVMGMQNDRARAALSGVKGVGLKMGSDVEEGLKSLTKADPEGRVVMLHIDPPTESLKLHLAESISPAKLSSKIPPSEPCYTFYAWPAPVSSSTTPRPSTTSEEKAVEQKAETNITDVDVDPASIELPVSPTDGAPPPPISISAATSPIEKSSSPPGKILFIYTCPSSSAVRHRMLYSSALRGVVKDAEDRFGFKVEKRLETSDISDLTESHLKSELQAVPLPSTSRPPSTGPSYGGGRQFPIPQRSSTTSSTNSGVSDVPSIVSSGGSLPDSAFSMFGPRVGSPGGGGGFARPKPAGRR